MYELVIDENNPTKDNVQILFESSLDDGFFLLRKYNEISVLNSLHEENEIDVNDKILFTVPSGMSSFTFDLDFGRRIFQNIELSYALEPGREYTIKGKRRSILIVTLGYNVELYDTTEGSKLLREWEL
jgi:hypothetical protein